MYLYRLWRFHPLPGHVYPPLPAGAAGIYHQLRRPQAAWDRTGISLSDFTNWWQGTLNECTGTEFTVEAEGEYLLFLNFPIEP